MSGIQEILVGPSRRWREDALKNLPYMGQRIGGGRYLENRPLLCAVRRNINTVLARTKSRKRLFGDVVDVKDLSIEALLSPIYRIREVRTALGIPQEIVIDRPY